MQSYTYSVKSIQYPDLKSLCGSLYQGLLKNPNDIDQIEISHGIDDIKINSFRIKWDNTKLIIYNDQNRLVITDFFPEYLPIELRLPHTKKPIVAVSEKPSGVPRANRHTQFLEKAKAIDESRKQKSIENQKNEGTSDEKKENSSTEKKHDEEFELKKEKVRDGKIALRREHEKLVIFKSDKETYLKIKSDYLEGRIKEIHPVFLNKYLIFKVLETKNAIDFKSHDNIFDEFEIFSLLEEDTVEDLDEQKKVKEEKPSKPFIPHNYHYMTREKKEELASRYNLSVEEFEKIYLSVSTQENIRPFNGTIMDESNNQ